MSSYSSTAVQLGNSVQTKRLKRLVLVTQRGQKTITLEDTNFIWLCKTAEAVNMSPISYIGVTLERDRMDARNVYHNTS